MDEATGQEGVRFAALPVGYEFAPAEFTISGPELSAYLEATGRGEGRAGSGTVVPPVAVAAFALRRLAGDLALEPGSVHGGQEYEFRRAVSIGEPLVATSRIANRSSRRGTAIMIIDQEVRAAGEVVVTGRSTLAVPEARATGDSV